MILRDHIFVLSFSIAPIKPHRPSEDDPKRPKMQLTQMQDIGGCRAVLEGCKEVRKLVDLHKTHRDAETIVKETDYIDDPKSDGYVRQQEDSGLVLRQRPLGKLLPREPRDD